MPELSTRQLQKLSTEELARYLRTKSLGDTTESAAPATRREQQMAQSPIPRALQPFVQPVLRLGAGVAEGIGDMPMSVMEEFSALGNNLARLFGTAGQTIGNVLQGDFDIETPEGLRELEDVELPRLSIVPQLEARNILIEANMLERIAQHGGEFASSFVYPVGVVGKAMTAKGFTKVLADMGLLTMASLAMQRAEARQAGVELTPRDYGTNVLFSSVAVPAGALTSKIAISSIQRLLNTELGETARRLASDIALGGAFGTFGSVQEGISPFSKEGLEKIATEIVGFTLGNTMAVLYPGPAKPFSKAQVEESLRISEEIIREYGIGLSEPPRPGQPTGKEPDYIRSVARSTYENLMTPLLETPGVRIEITPEALAAGTGVSLKQAGRIVRKPVPTEEILGEKWQAAQLEAAREAGLGVYNETAYRLKQLSPGDRKVYEAQREKLSPESRDALYMSRRRLEEAFQRDPEFAGDIAEVVEQRVGRARLRRSAGAEQAQREVEAMEADLSRPAREAQARELQEGMQPRFTEGEDTATPRGRGEPATRAEDVRPELAHEDRRLPGPGGRYVSGPARTREALQNRLEERRLKGENVRIVPTVEENGTRRFRILQERRGGPVSEPRREPEAEPTVTGRKRQAAVRKKTPEKTEGKEFPRALNDPEGLLSKLYSNKNRARKALERLEELNPNAEFKLRRSITTTSRKPGQPRQKRTMYSIEAPQTGGRQETVTRAEPQTRIVQERKPSKTAMRKARDKQRQADRAVSPVEVRRRPGGPDADEGGGGGRQAPIVPIDVSRETPAEAAVAGLQSRRKGGQTPASAAGQPSATPKVTGKGKTPQAPKTPEQRARLKPRVVPDAVPKTNTQTAARKQFGAPKEGKTLAEYNKEIRALEREIADTEARARVFANQARPPRGDARYKLWSKAKAMRAAARNLIFQRAQLKENRAAWKEVRKPRALTEMDVFGQRGGTSLRRYSAARPDFIDSGYASYLKRQAKRGEIVQKDDGTVAKPPEGKDPPEGGIGQVKPELSKKPIQAVLNDARAVKPNETTVRAEPKRLEGESEADFKARRDLEKWFEQQNEAKKRQEDLRKGSGSDDSPTLWQLPLLALGTAGALAWAANGEETEGAVPVIASAFLIPIGRKGFLAPAGRGGSGGRGKSKPRPMAISGGNTPIERWTKRILDREAKMAEPKSPVETKDDAIKADRSKPGPKKSQETLDEVNELVRKIETTEGKDALMTADELSEFAVGGVTNTGGDTYLRAQEAARGITPPKINSKTVTEFFRTIGHALTNKFGEWGKLIGTPIVSLVAESQRRWRVHNEDLVQLSDLRYDVPLSTHRRPGQKRSDYRNLHDIMRQLYWRTVMVRYHKRDIRYFERAKKRGQLGERVERLGTYKTLETAKRTLEEVRASRPRGNYRIKQTKLGYRIENVIHDRMTLTAEMADAEIARLKKDLAKAQAVKIDAPNSIKIESKVFAWADRMFSTPLEQLEEVWGRQVSNEAIREGDGFAKFVDAAFAKVKEEALARGLPFMAWQRGAYLPVMFPDFVFPPSDRFRFLTNFDQKMSVAQEYQALIAHDVSRRTRLPVGDALYILSGHANRQGDPFWRVSMEDVILKRAANLEKHRMLDTRVGIEWDFARISPKYFRSAFTRFEYAKRFGVNGELLERALAMAQRDGYNAAAMGRLIDLATGQGAALMRGERIRLLDEVSGWVAFAKLGGAGISQISSWPRIAEHVDPKSFFDAWRPALEASIEQSTILPRSFKDRWAPNGKFYARMVAETGSMGNAELVSAIMEMSGIGPKAAALLLKFNLTTSLDRFGRNWAAIAGRYYMSRLLREYGYARKSGNAEGARKSANRLRELFGRDPWMMEKALEGEWMKKFDPKKLETIGENARVEMDLLENAGAQLIGDRSHGRNLPIDMPLNYSHPVLGHLYKLQVFNFRMTAEAFRMFNPRDPASPLRTPAGALRMLSGLIALGLPTSWVLLDLKRRMRHEDPSRWAETPAWRKVADLLAFHGVFTAFIDGFDILTARYGPPIQRGTGVTGGTIAEAMNAMANTWKQSTKAGELQFGPLGRFGFRQIPSSLHNYFGVPTGKELGLKAFPPQRGGGGGIQSGISGGIESGIEGGTP